MTTKYELTKMYNKGKLILVCMMSYKKYQKGETDQLEHLIGDQVIQCKPAKPQYKNYSHGICRPCMQEHYADIYNQLESRGISYGKP